MRTRARLIGAVGMILLGGQALAWPSGRELQERWYKVVIATVDTGVRLEDGADRARLTFPRLAPQEGGSTRVTRTLFDSLAGGTERSAPLTPGTFFAGEVPAVCFQRDQLRGWDGLRIEVRSGVGQATAVVFNAGAFPRIDAPASLAGSGIKPSIEGNAIVLQCPSNAGDDCCVTVVYANGSEPEMLTVPRDAYYVGSLFTTAGVTMRRLDPDETCGDER